MAGLITEWLERAAQENLNQSNQPSWLQAKRQIALRQIQTLSEPSRKLESWRYADVSRLSQNLDPSSENGHRQQLSESAGDADVDNVEIVIKESGYLYVENCPEWLEIHNMNEVNESDWYDIQFNQESVVNLANNLLFQVGGLIRVKKVEQALKIKITYDFDEIDSWQYVQNQFVIEAGASLQLTESHRAGRVNAVNAFNLGEGVVLNRRQDFRLSASEQFVSYNQFEVAGNVEINNMNHHIGGSLQHHVHWVNFNAETSKYQSGSVNKSFNNNNITDIVNVNHNYKNNMSDVTHRSIAKDQSQIYNNAKALVAVGADGSEIEQDLKNILLSPDAKIFSKPELEVYADEVVAAHGSTIGALDDKALFYLQSRGVDIEQAREIMIESFEQEAVLF